MCSMWIRVSSWNGYREQILQFQQYVKQHYPYQTVSLLEIAVDGEHVSLRTHLQPQRFERIRRITGYLTGDMNRWNNAKRAEEGDRVKHT